MSGDKDLCRLLFETASDASLVWQDGRVVDCNHSAETMFGSPQQLLIGQTAKQLWSSIQPDPNSSNHSFYDMLAAATPGQQEAFDCQLQRSDGVTFYAQVTLRAVEFGQEVIVHTSIRDVTEQKQAVKALEQQQAFLRQLIDLNPHFIFVKDREGRFALTNQAFAEAYGTTVEALIGKTDADVNPSQEMVDHYDRDDMGVIESGQELFIPEEEILNIKGERLWRKTVKRPVFDENREVQYVLGVASDITALKLSEQALRQREERLRTFLNTLPDIAFILDETGRYLEVLVSDNNPRYSGAVERLQNRTVHEILSPEQAELFLSTISRTITRQEPQIIEYTFQEQSGEFWFEGRVLPVTVTGGEPDTVVWLARDITDRKRLESEIQESLERRGRQVILSSLVAQETVAVASLDDLYQRIVTQVKEQFGFYHVQLLRHEVDSKMLVLAAGYGEVGQAMLAEGYQVPMGVGPIGQAAALGNPMLRSSRDDPLDWQPDPRLPNATAELVLPIRLGQQDAQAQVTALNAFIENDFDGFIVCVIDPDIVQDVVSSALAKGVHVLTQSHNLGVGNQTSYVGAEEYETGFMLGLQAGEWAKQHLSTDEILKVGIFNHRTLPPVVQREQGIIDGLRAGFRREFEIVENEQAPNPVQSMPIANKWLQTYPDLRMILGINDGSALGAYRAVIAAGKNDPHQFFIGGIDAIDEALSAIADGGAYQATVDKSPRIEGLIAIRTLVAAILGQPFQEKNTVKTMPVNRANLDDFYLNRLSQNFEGMNGWQVQELPKIKVGLSVMNLNNPFFATFAQVVSEEAERLGIELVVNDPKPVLGVLNVQTDSADALDAEDQLALEGLSGQIAVAIQNTRLLEEASIFRQFADASGQGLSMATVEGRIVYVNRALVQILGENGPEDTVGESLVRYYPDKQQEFVVNEVIPTVLQQGQWIGESVLRSAQGKLIPVIENYFLILDQAGAPRYLADVITDISAQKQTEAELETRLQELSALQRLMTREGWKTYQPSGQETTWGYMFDQTDVRPVTRREIKNGDTHPATPAHPAPDNGHSLVKAVAVHGEIIGRLGVIDDPDHPLNPEDQEFLDLIAGQVAEALERARLLEQTQQRAVELEAVAEVSTAASTALEVDRLLQQVVDLTKSSFSLYHAHIYLINDNGTVLNLVAGADEVGRKMVAQGWSIPLEQERSIVARAARTQQGVIVNDVRAEFEFLPNPLLPETRSEMAVPLIAGSRLLGVLDVQADVVDRFADGDMQIQTTLAAQVAVALRNASLYTQIHEALTETEVLYDISAQINAAVNLDEALLAASAPAMATGAESAQLLTFDLDEEGKPEWAIVTVVWVYEGTPRLSVGTRIYLPDLPFAKLWIDDPFTPVLISDVVEDERLIPALRDAFLATDIRASVIMPLSLAGRWVGLITVNWTTPHLFTLTDQRLYKSLATQSAVVVNNLLLYEEAQQRASLLEKLTQIEVALSQSGNEAEIIRAMAQVVEVDLSAHIVLQYIDGDQSGSPTSLRTVASWRDGTAWSDDPALGVSEAVDDIVGAQLWLNASDTVQFFTDAALDLRLAASSGTPVALNGLRGLALLPLFSGGRWQGLATYRWPEPHDFTSDERFVFQQMLEPMAAAVASRRAYLVQQEALAETEALYIASRRINEAASLHEIVAAVAETGPVSIVSRAVLQTIDNDTMGEAQALTVAAVWQRSNTSSPVPLGTSYPISRYPHLRLFFGPDPVVFDDLQLDERLNEESVELMEQLSVRAMIVLPLWAGARQLGVLTLECDKSYDFTEREVQPYIALASQVGVALENQRLLTETSRALADAEVTQRRYTVQAWGKYLATNKSLLYQQFRRGNTSWTDELPAGLAHFETAEVPIKTDPADVKQVDDSDRPASEEIKSRLVVPLTVRGEIIGLLGLEESAEREWTPEERSLVQAIGQQLAQAAENLRLIDETQKRAAQEQRVNEIGEKIRAAQSLEEALQIAVKEVGLSLQTPAASVRLEAE